MLIPAQIPVQITPHLSPNHSERRGGLCPRLIVLHYTAMAGCDVALARLCAPEHEVSAHYLISRHGEAFQLVDEARRAWHAGAGIWAGAGDVNSRSIGVELDNDGVSPFAAAQIDRLEQLLAGIMARWNIPPEAVIAHSDIAPMRKVDPGRRFDWRRLARRGLGVWPQAGAAVALDRPGFLQAAAGFGYAPEFGFEAVHSAFRQRFRPHAFGPLEGADMAAITELAARYPVDLARPSA